MIKEISSYLDHKYPKNKGFFIFGSYVYGTWGKDSDIDVVVIEDSLHGQSVSGKYDLQFVSEEAFRNQLRKCDIKALEGFFTDLKNLKIKVSSSEIDWSNLRASISEKSSHSWVKAKKKLIDQEFYIGKKSLFHSLRIVKFGIQLAKTKKIENFSEANDYLHPILSGPTDWESLLGQYKREYNSLHSEFKALQPK